MATAKALGLACDLIDRSKYSNRGLEPLEISEVVFREKVKIGDRYLRVLWVTVGAIQ